MYTFISDSMPLSSKNRALEKREVRRKKGSPHFEWKNYFSSQYYNPLKWRNYKKYMKILVGLEKILQSHQKKKKKFFKLLLSYYNTLKIYLS